MRRQSALGFAASVRLGSCCAGAQTLWTIVEMARALAGHGAMVFVIPLFGRCRDLTALARMERSFEKIA
jgi:hypothetical protein